MKCKDCNSCRQGYFKSKPTTYVCTGVKEPFEIYDTESECTEYPEKRNEKKPITKFITVSDKLWDKMKDADRVVFERQAIRCWV